MLAAETPAAIQFPVMASYKIDGVRCVIKDAQPLSRSLKVIRNEHVQRVLGFARLEGLDGELTVGPPNAPDLMQRTTSGVMTIAGQPDFTYWVFDFWTAPEMPFERRYERLRESELLGWFAQFPQVRILPQRYISNQQQLDEYETIALAEGYEGIMLRKPDGPYKYNRSTAREGYLLKVKRFVDGEAVVRGFVELQHNDNVAEFDALGFTKRSTHNANKVGGDTLGGLEVTDLATGIPFTIGTGFDAVLRKEIWLHQEAWLGRIVKYKHFAAVGVKDAPRFPVYLGVRDLEDM
jgi:DNA ligase-1